MRGNPKGDDARKPYRRYHQPQSVSSQSTAYKPGVGIRRRFAPSSAAESGGRCDSGKESASSCLSPHLYPRPCNDHGPATTKQQSPIAARRGLASERAIYNA